VLVPRSGPNQEQLIRSERLRRWGVARVVQARDATSTKLTAEIYGALNGEPPRPAPVPLDGLGNAIDVFEHALASTADQPARHR
jgi:predicted glycosyltransferase